MTEFTKGTWVAVSRGCFNGQEEGDVHQKDNWDVGMQDGEFMRGNFRMEDAHLIAAAPDLYEALDALTEMARRMDFSEGICCCGDSVENHGFGSGHSPVDAGLHYSTEVIEAARAALAKARGEV